MNKIINTSVAITLNNFSQSFPTVGGFKFWDILQLYEI